MANEENLIQNNPDRLTSEERYIAVPAGLTPITDKSPPNAPIEPPIETKRAVPEGALSNRSEMLYMFCELANNGRNRNIIGMMRFIDIVFFIVIDFQFIAINVLHHYANRLIQNRPTQNVRQRKNCVDAKRLCCLGDYIHSNTSCCYDTKLCYCLS